MLAGPRWDELGRLDSPRKGPWVEKRLKLSPGSGCLQPPHQAALVPSLPCRSLPQDGGQRRSFPDSWPLCQPGQGEMGLHAHPQDASRRHTQERPRFPSAELLQHLDCILSSLEVISPCPALPCGSGDLWGTPGCLWPGLRGLVCQYGPAQPWPVAGVLCLCSGRQDVCWRGVAVRASAAAHVSEQRPTASCPAGKTLGGVPGGLGQAGQACCPLPWSRVREVQPGGPHKQHEQSLEGLAACG